MVLCQQQKAGFLGGGVLLQPRTAANKRFQATAPLRSAAPEAQIVGRLGAGLHLGILRLYKIINITAPALRGKGNNNLLEGPQT